MSPRPRILALLVALIAAPAIAQTEQSLVLVANNLDASYDTLLYDVQHAGTSGHTALLVRFNALEVARADLHEDRQAIEPCGCTLLDSLIAGIDVTSDTIAVIIDDWDAAPRKSAEPPDQSVRSHADTHP